MARTFTSPTAASPNAQVPYGAGTSHIKRTFFMLIRTFFNFTTIGFPVISLVLAVAAVSSGSFHASEGGERWYEANAWYGQCVCENILQSPCSERADAFGATAWLSTAALVSAGLVCLLQLWELSAYGMYGAGHTYTRLIIIGCLVSLGSLIFSLAAYHSMTAVEHCGLPALSSDGYSFFAAPGMQIANVLLMTGYTIHAATVFRRTVRGPPMLSTANLAVIVSLITVTTISRTWMKKDGPRLATTLLAGVWSTCKCGCNDFEQMEIGLVLGFVAITFQTIAVYFATMRAVDTKGTTVIHTNVFLFIAMGLLIGASVMMADVLSDDVARCPEIEELSYWPYYSGIWGFWVLIVCIVLNFLSFVTNCVYKCPVCDCCEYEGLSEGDRTLYRAMWFTQLKDPRLVEYERGGEAAAEMQEEGDVDVYAK